MSRAATFGGNQAQIAHRIDHANAIANGFVQILRLLQQVRVDGVDQVPGPQHRAVHAQLDDRVAATPGAAGADGAARARHEQLGP